jgi:hypothetical protein
MIFLVYLLFCYTFLLTLSPFFEGLIAVRRKDGREEGRKEGISENNDLRQKRKSSQVTPLLLAEIGIPQLQVNFLSFNPHLV